MSPKSVRSRKGAGLSERERYRLAAETALDQLDWAIDYLHGVRESRIARALAANRSRIRRQLR